MSTPLNDLGEALEAQIYATVMGSDDKVEQPDPDTFLTWCRPGLAFSTEAFDFAAKGIGSAETAEEQKIRSQQAYNFAALTDFVPDVGLAYSSDRQAGMFKPDAQVRLSELYRQILRFSKVVDHELTAEEQAKLEKFRNLLWTTKTTKNLVTDEEDEVVEEGPVLKLYNQKLADYIAAAKEYNAKRVAYEAATGAEGKAAVSDWQRNASTYYLQVKAAMDAWVSGGYRWEVDDMNAYINQVTQRSMRLWKQELLEAYDKAGLTIGDVEIPVRYTTVVPGDFATSEGWTELGLTQESVSRKSSSSQRSWKAGGKVGWGGLSVGGEGGRETSRETKDVQIDSFELSFELTQVLLVKPWLYGAWFKNRGWTLDKGEGWMFDEMPSDGKEPPSGNFVGYPTQAIFIRNLNIKSEALVEAFEKESSSLSAGGSVGWGPFKLTGSYSDSRASEEFTAQTDGQWLRVKGMQCIAFVNHLVGKAPDLLPDIDPETLV